MVQGSGFGVRGSVFSVLNPASWALGVPRTRGHDRGPKRWRPEGQVRNLEKAMGNESHGCRLITDFSGTKSARCSQRPGKKAPCILNSRGTLLVPFVDTSLILNPEP